MSGRKLKLARPHQLRKRPIPCEGLSAATQAFYDPRVIRQSTAQVNLRPPVSSKGGGTTQCRNAERSDGWSTDPDPNMDMQQAHVRNMRSKCRCSCVLQFTLRHGVSSVLHRPPSQMIHCIVLYLGFRHKGQLGFCMYRFSQAQRGEHKTQAGGEAL
jgi:hypothetical protein